MSDLFWTDSHCHLVMDDFDDDRKEAIARAQEAGVKRMVFVGTNSGDWEAACELALEYGFRSTAGLHPHEASSWDRECKRHLESMLDRTPVSAVGEIGLDYHYDFSPREVQRTTFSEQCEIAVRKGLPVVIHSREAFEDTRDILRDFTPTIKGVIHCYTYGPSEAEAFLEMGFNISFSGIVTFPKAPLVREAASLVPHDRLMIETDAPYLAPVPYRGKRCEPAHVAAVGDFLSEFLMLSTDDMKKLTSENTSRLLDWPL